MSIYGYFPRISSLKSSLPYRLPSTQCHLEYLGILHRKPPRVVSRILSVLKPYVHGAESLVGGGGYVLSGVLLHWQGWFLV
jgi:hypothetical protein